MPAFSDDPVIDFVVAEAATRKVAKLRAEEDRKREGAANRNPRNHPDLAAKLRKR